MNPSNFTAIASQDMWVVVRYMFLVGIVLYIAFALVIVRQVGLMTKTLSVGFEFPIKLLAWLHMLAAITLFVLAFIYL